MKAGCAGESLEQHGRPLMCLISFQSFSIDLGRWGLCFIFQAVRKQESSQSLSDCQLGRWVSPLVVQICLLSSLVFCTLQPYVMTGSEDRMLVGFKCCACPSCLPISSTPESSYRWEYLCFNTLSRDNSERGSHFWHCSMCLWKFALFVPDTILLMQGDGSGILIWTPVDTGLY